MSVISVIVPVYKVEPYLHRCIDSILGQTFADFELILVDDGSPDNCPRICDEYAQKDSRITVIHKENGGLSSARNAGLDWMFRNSNSEYVSFIDSDDWIHPQYLEFLYRALTEKDSDLSCCLFQKVNAECGFDDTAFSYESVLPDFLWKNYRTEAVIAFCKLYKRELFNNLRYPVGLIHEDEYTTFKALFSCDKISFVDLPLYYYFENLEGIMLSRWNVKRLDTIVAYYEQYVWFAENGYPEFAKEALISYLYSHVDAIEKLKEFCPNENKLIRKTRTDLRKNLKKYASEIDLKNRSDKNSFLRVAYPLRYGIFHKFKKYLSYIKKHRG